MSNVHFKVFFSSEPVKPKNLLNPKNCKYQKPEQGEIQTLTQRILIPTTQSTLLHNFERQIRETIDSFNFSSRWHGPLCVNGVWTRAIWCYDLVVNGGLCWSLTRLSARSKRKAHEMEEDIWNPTSIDSMTMGFKESSSFHTCVSVETIHCLVEKTQYITKYYDDFVQNSIDVLMTAIEIEQKSNKIEWWTQYGINNPNTLCSPETFKMWS